MTIALSLVGAEHLSDVLGMLQSVGVTRIFEDAPPHGAHEMGVGVDESREDGLASAVNDAQRWGTGTGGRGSGLGRPMHPPSTARAASYRMSLLGLEVTMVALVKTVDMVFGFYLREVKVETCYRGPSFSGPVC